MLDTTRQIIKLYEAMVTLNHETFVILLGEYPHGNVTALSTILEHEAKSPPVESEICRYLRIKPTQLKTIETTQRGGIIYAATLNKETK